jgi:hypothetical protein
MILLRILRKIPVISGKLQETAMENNNIYHQVFLLLLYALQLNIPLPLPNSNHHPFLSRRLRIAKRREKKLWKEKEKGKRPSWMHLRSGTNWDFLLVWAGRTSRKRIGKKRMKNGNYVGRVITHHSKNRKGSVVPSIPNHVQSPRETAKIKKRQIGIRSGSYRKYKHELDDF